MAFSRRSFRAAAAAALAACSKPARRLAGASTSTAPTTTPPTPRPVPTAAHTGPARVLYSGPRDRQQIALTFHGSGDPALTAQLLAEAKRASAPITVFAVGRWLEPYPDIARRLRAAGPELEHHTPPHPQPPRATAAVLHRAVTA